MRGFPDLPPIWWATSIAAIYLAKWLLPSWHFENVTFGYLSQGVFFFALAVIAWSAVWFWRKRTPIEPHHTPKSLIIEGPYRLSRNPIYLALVLLTFSSSIGHGSLIGLIATFALWKVLDTRFAAKEEALLRQQFGEAALDYFAGTRRWV